LTRHTTLFLTGILSATFCGAAPERVKQEAASIQIYALKYGESDYPARLVNTDAKTEKVRLGWLAYLIEYRAGTAKRLTLVDCGFTDKKLVARFGLRDFRPVWRLVTDLGYKAEDINRIFLTHTHFDHALDADRFPQAIVYAGDEEIRNPADPILAPVLAKLKKENRLRGIGGPIELEKGMQLIPVRGHTRGSLAVRMTHGKSIAYFTGDELPRQNSPARRGSFRPGQ
jgi:glyoxylase-like metal-dependent hydrolase (beta-lactamase superfamily II)